MYSIKVILFKHNKLKNGEHPIYLRIIKDRKVRYMKIGRSCPVSLWDEKNNLPKKKHPFYKELLVVIGDKKSEAERLYYHLEIDDKNYSAEQVKTKLRKGFSQNISVLKYFEEVITRLENAERLGYADVFKSTRNNLKKFIGEKDITFSDVTDSFIRKFEEDLYSREVVPNSVFVYLRTFKTLLNYAKKDEIILENFNPFKDFSFAKFRRIKTRKRAIEKDMIGKIEKLEFEPNSKLFHSKNYFLFSFYNRGINFVDMAHLKWQNIENGILRYKRKKTDEEFVIGILKPALEILQFYKKNYFSSVDDYIFPILNNNHKTALSIYNRIHKVNRQVNSDLKAIAKTTGIDGGLTTYTARHSYATILKKSGISTAIISEALGHESEKTTQIYLDSFGSEILNEASKAILTT
ncbi:MAG: Tyrosine recombinase XerC [Bacteroidia bacterium]|nr:Tyrosine recombinase XerC [Bacteroidia bacterium]